MQNISSTRLPETTKNPVLPLIEIQDNTGFLVVSGSILILGSGFYVSILC